MVQAFSTVQVSRFKMISALSEVLVHRIGSFLPVDALSTSRKVDTLLYRELQSAMVGAVSARLEDADWHVRYRAVKALEKLAEKGDAGVIRAVSARLDDADKGVQFAAVEALGQMAVKGDAGVIRAVSARLEDAYAHVRVAAVQALEEIAEKGDTGVIRAVPEIWYE